MVRAKCQKRSLVAKGSLRKTRSVRESRDAIQFDDVERWLHANIGDDVDDVVRQCMTDILDGVTQILSFPGDLIPIPPPPPTFVNGFWRINGFLKHERVKYFEVVDGVVKNIK